MFNYPPMKTLEQKIIKKVYLTETKNYVGKILLFFAVAAVGLLFGIILYNQLVEQRTLDMLQIFQEDGSVIRMYLGQVLSDVYYETPKIPLFLSLFSVVFVIIFLLIFIRNFGRIKKVTRSLLKFWVTTYEK